jgi:hypothetical protein
MLARSSHVSNASSLFLACARTLITHTRLHNLPAPTAPHPLHQRNAMCLLFLAQSLRRSHGHTLPLTLFNRALLQDESLAEAVDGIRSFTPDVLSLLPLLHSFPLASCPSTALLDVVLTFISSFQAPPLPQALHSVLSKCISLLPADASAVQRGLLPSAAVYVLHSPALLTQVLHHASLAFPTPPPLPPPPPAWHIPIHIAYILPSLNPALLYFNLRDVFKSHARAHVTYINTCDKEFPQDAKWGSASNLPIFLSGSRVSLSSACGTSQAAVDIAAFINRLSVHVLVDPMGWGSGHRQDVLAHRPAPVQIGAIFPAAHACSYIKYTILDARVSPPELSPPSRPSFTRPLLLPFYSPSQHAATYGSGERVQWDAAADVSRLELLANVWHAWWRGRGDVRLAASDISNAMTGRGSQAPNSCDGVMHLLHLPADRSFLVLNPSSQVVMIAPAKGFKWDAELVLQWLRAAADVERALHLRCNTTRPILSRIASFVPDIHRAALPPRVMLVFMNWTSIDSSIRGLNTLADSHGLLHVARDHIVVLPRVAHADYMKRCGKKLAVCARIYTTIQFSSHFTSRAQVLLEFGWIRVNTPATPRPWISCLRWLCRFLLRGKAWRLE